MQRKSLMHVFAAGAAMASFIFAGVTELRATPEVVVATPAPSGNAYMSSADLEQVVLPTGLAADRKDCFGLIYSGFRQSAIEPCGCVSNKLGGIDRDARVLEKLDELKIPVVKVDAGGFLRSQPNDLALRRTRALFKAWQKMGMQAVNVGAVDLNQGIKFLRDAQTSWSVPLISANLLSASDKKLLFEPYKITIVTLTSGATVRVGIVGVTHPADGQSTMSLLHASASADLSGSLAHVSDSPASQRWMVRPEGRGQGADLPSSAEAEVLFLDPIEALSKVLPELHAKCDTIVLLDYDKVEPMRLLVEALPPQHGISAAVAGEFLMLLPIPQEVNGVTVMTSGFEGRQLGNLMIEFKDGKVGRRKNAIIPISQMVEPLPSFTEIIESYKHDISALPNANASNIPTPQRKISYISSVACVECHKAEYDQWRGTAHAKAFASLIEKGEQNNASCVKCHVTGYQVDNGFSDYKTTPEYANVQCEVCHGPAYEHVVQSRRSKILARMNRPSVIPDSEKAVMNMTFDAKYCSACHDAKNDPDFDFEKMIHQVDHSTTADSNIEKTTAPLATSPTLQTRSPAIL